MSQAEGCFLVASPYLSDPHFFRTVVYIIRHDSEGAFGVVINRPGEVPLEDAVGESLSHHPRREDRIYLGGPVEGPLLALHTLVGVGDPCVPKEMAPESATLWLTSDEDHLRLLADRTDVEARFIASYSGWGPGQLDAELRVGGWLLAEAESSELFSDPSPLWEILVRKQGREVLASLVPSLDKGFDPQVN